MSEIETPISDGGAEEAAADAMSGTRAGGGLDGRTGGGDSTGGGSMGHDGQTSNDDRGGGQGEEGGGSPNAATGADSSDGTEKGAVAWRAPHYHPRQITAGGRTFEVVETNGVAEAEASGKIGTDAPYEREQESPGSG